MSAIDAYVQDATKEKASCNSALTGLNKVFSGEHDEQLGKYKKFAGENYQGYETHFIYLTPHGTESSDPETWRPMSYALIMDIVRDALENTEGITDECRYLIQQYLDTVRRDVMGEDEIVEMCREVYNKHRTAIDMIIKYRDAHPEELSIGDDVRITAERLFRHLSDAGYEGVFELEFGKPMDIDAEGYYGIYAHQNHGTALVGKESEVSADSVARALARLWDEVDAIVKSDSGDNVIKVSNESGGDEIPVVTIQVMTLVKDNQTALELAAERQLSEYLDLSNELIVETEQWLPN